MKAQVLGENESEGLARMKDNNIDIRVIEEGLVIASPHPTQVRKFVAVTPGSLDVNMRWSTNHCPLQWGTQGVRDYDVCTPVGHPTHSN